MGKRKLWLKHVKNYERKKRQNRQLKVSIPLQLVKPTPVSSLIVSVPLNSYIKSSAPSADALHSRLNKSKLFPKGWTTSLLMSESHSSLFSIKGQIQNSLLDIIITVAPDCAWSISIGTSQFSIDDCQLMKSFLSKLNSVDMIKRLLSCLDNSKVCNGNSDEKFYEILECYFTVDKSGKCQ